jgi:alcohol dehydrogenase class IV
MRSALMIPSMAVIDPELTYSLPPALTAATGLDALTQLIEAYVSNKANPMTDALCREGITRAARSLRRACEDRTNQAARCDMSLAALCSGLALANAKLGAVHGFAGPLGGMIPAPHGVICAALLPQVMETNLRALEERASNSPALARFDEIARLLTGISEARSADGVTWIQNLCRELPIPSLTQYGLNEKDFPTLVTKAQNASSMKGTPLPHTPDELTHILQKAI